MLKEIFITLVDSLAIERDVTQFVNTYSKQWDGYIPVNFPQHEFENLSSRYETNKHTTFMLNQVEYILKCPKIAIDYLIYKEGITDISKLADKFGVGESFMYKALLYHKVIK